MAAKKGKEAGVPDKEGFVEEPDFGNAPEVEEPVEETHEGRNPYNAKIESFLAENPEFALRAQALADTPDELKIEIVRQDIVRARQEESRNNGVWAKLNTEPKLVNYYNNMFKQIPDGPGRRKAICEEYYRSLRIEGNYINPRFYDRNVTREQVNAYIEKNPERMKELDRLQSEGGLMMAYARNEYDMTAGERAAKRKVDQFLKEHEPDRNKIESMSDDELRDSVVRDTYFRVSRKEAVSAVVTEWLDRSPGVKMRLEKEHADKEPEYRRNSILKDASEAYRKATGKAPKGERIEFDEERLKQHMETHPEVYEPIYQMSRDELIVRDVQRRRSGSARAWEASPKIAWYNELLKQFNPKLHQQIVSHARFNEEPFRTQKIASAVETKGAEFLAQNPQLAQKARSISMGH